MGIKRAYGGREQMKFELLTGEVCSSDLLMHKAYSVPTLFRVVFIKARSCSQHVAPPKGLRRFYSFGFYHRIFLEVVCDICLVAQRPCQPK